MSREGQVIISLRLLWDVITHTCPKYLLLSPRNLYNRQFKDKYWAHDLEIKRLGLILFRNCVLSFSLYWMTEYHGPLARYVKLRFAHARGMPGKFSPPPRVSDPDMHHGTCIAHVPRCMSGSLLSVSFDVGGGENVPGIPSACATCNFTYLIRGPAVGTNWKGRLLILSFLHLVCTPVSITRNL